MNESNAVYKRPDTTMCVAGQAFQLREFLRGSKTSLNRETVLVPTLTDRYLLCMLKARQEYICYS